jgi:OmpA-OmpF porin, OOP family
MKITPKIIGFFPLLLIVGTGMGQINVNTNSIKGLFKKKSPPKDTTQATSTNPAAPNTTAQNGSGPSTPGSTAPTGTLASYQNYDFVPGNKVLFEDEFTDDESGEFPTHWSLAKGQAILNMVGPDKAFFLTDGNYVHVAPLMKNNSYLTSSFSVEYDVYGTSGYQGLLTMFDAGGNTITICVKPGDVEFAGPSNFGGAIPADIGGNNYLKKWHHIAVAYKNNQVKVYVDKYRVLIVPQAGLQPTHLDMEGIGDQNNPIIFKSFKISDSVQFYMTGQKFTDAKLVTHGINFDIDKATITPQSMGTLNMIVKLMRDNADLKFEVDGHTDNTGTAAHNMTLSQQRAAAVMAQLITMGIDAARLSSKGFGDTKPMADNSTLDGKANNRRVEFVKQ